MRFHTFVLIGLLTIGCSRPGTTDNKTTTKTADHSENSADGAGHVTSDKLTVDLQSLLDTVDLEAVSAGELHLPTGRIVAGDPFFVTDNKPFKTAVTPGNYPVKLLIFKVEEDHYRVAFAKIQFSDLPATHWTLALTEDITEEDVKTLKQGEFFGYGVDAGMGCFTDVETNGIFNNVMDDFYKNGPDKNYYDDVLA